MCINQRCSRKVASSVLEILGKTLSRKCISDDVLSWGLEGRSWAPTNFCLATRSLWPVDARMSLQRGTELFKRSTCTEHLAYGRHYKDHAQSASGWSTLTPKLWKKNCNSHMPVPNFISGSFALPVHGVLLPHLLSAHQDSGNKLEVIWSCPEWEC